MELRLSQFGNNTEHKKVLAAVSGGLDSMCLLHALINQKDVLKIRLAVVTVNHNLRGKDSLLDAEFVADYCAQSGIECRVCSVDVMANSSKKGFNTEAEARKLRYEAVFRTGQELGCDIIATAHHAGDNAESVLLNILRGAGLNGAAGIAANRDGIIRPLINLTRKELEQYALYHKLKYRTDATNYDTDFSRNFIRHEILPRLNERFPNAAGNINAFSERARIDDEFIDSLITGINICGDTAEAPLKYFENAATGVRAAKKALAGLGLMQDITAVNYRDIGRLFDMEKGAVILLKNGIRAVRGYDKIVFTKGQKEIIDYELPFCGGVTLTPYGSIEAVKDSCPNGSFKQKLAGRADGELLVSADAVAGAVWRNRRLGDNFKRIGGGTKKLNDYFTDIKLDDGLRDSVPLLANGSEILAVAGIEISDRARVRDEPGTETGFFRIKYNGGNVE